jgi:hypothetical protein
MGEPTNFDRKAREFELGRDVHENVRNLRRALGSVAAELSAARLAGLVGSAHPTRRVSPSQVQRWEVDVEPDYLSTIIMAHYAGVSFEQFALGSTQYVMAGATMLRLHAVDPSEEKPADHLITVEGTQLVLNGMPPLAREMIQAMRDVGPDADPDEAIALLLKRRAERPKRGAEIEPPPIPAPRGKTHAEAVAESEKVNEKKPKRA